MTLNNSEEVYQVVVNHEKEYSICPDEKEASRPFHGS